MSLLECVLFHQIRFRDHRMVNHLVGGYNGDMEIVLNDLTQTNPYPDCLEDFEKYLRMHVKKQAEILIWSVQSSLQPQNRFMRSIEPTVRLIARQMLSHLHCRMILQIF